MNDLERDIRELLDEEVRSAPQPHERAGALRRTRRRQGTVVAGGALAAVALVAASLLGLRAIERADDPTFGDQPIVATDINGITISHPEGWYVVDPDETGLNGPDPAPDLPKLILAVAPFDPGRLFACPGMAQGTAHQFLMTIQEEPRALNGPASSPWPVELEPLGVDAAESACYPGWEFLRAGWTAAGRTFEGRVGFAPDVSDADRDALLAAFASMTFGSMVDSASSAVLTAGTSGGEDWELIAGRGLLPASGESVGLELMLNAESISAGIGGFDPSSREIVMSDQVLGTGAGAERFVFGAVSADAARLGLQVSGGDPVALAAPEILDVPDTIDSDLNAFVFTIRLDQTAVVTAFDDSNTPMAYAQIGPEGMGPIATPTPDEVIFEGRTNDCFWTLSRTSVGTHEEHLDLTSRDSELLTRLVVDLDEGAAPLQLASFDCAIDETDAVLVFGIATEEVTDVDWTDPIGDDGGPPECLPAELPPGFCFFLADFSGPGEAVALDENGDEVARVPYG